MGKRKAKGRKIPLSRLDKFMYFLIGVSGGALAFAIWWLFASIIPNNLTYSDETAIGLSIGLPLILTSLIFSFLLVIPIVAFPCHWYSQKQPLFGNKSFKPRFGAGVIPTYPLFSKKYFESLDAKYKKTVKKLMLVWAVSTLIALCFLLPNICCRTVLYENDTVKQFNSFNEISHNCNFAAAESAGFSITRSSNRNSGIHYGLSFAIDHGDHRHSFSINELRVGTLSEELEYMLYIKRQFGRDYKIYGIEFIDEFIREDKLDASEIALLYELVDYNAS